MKLAMDETNVKLREASNMSKHQCRLCAEYKQQNELVHVQESDIAITLDLEQKINNCFNLNFNNSLPKHVCLQCSEQVTVSHKFREQVLKAQQLLEPILEYEYHIKSEGSECGEDNDAQNYEETLVKSELSDEDSDDQKPLSSFKIKKEVKRRKRRPKEIVENDEVDSDKLKNREERRLKIQQIKEIWKSYIWKCVICEMQLPSLNDLNTHYPNIHSRSPQYQCMECPTTFDVFYNFRRHVGTHRDKNKFQCSECDRSFSSSKHLRGHLEIHSTERKYICSMCGKSFKTASTLRSHRKSHSPEKFKYACDLCGKKLTTKVALSNHQKMHQGIKDHTCEQCGKSFIQQSTLKEHIQAIHSDEFPYVCATCSKRFKTPQNLNKHLQVHSENRRHGCDVCGKRFHRKGTLDLHKTVHNDAMPFECEYCQKRFRRKQFLKVHIRQHTGERPYSCLDCNQHFSDSSNYIKHMRGRHGVMQSIRKNVPYQSFPSNPAQAKQPELFVNTMQVPNQAIILN